MTRPFSLALVLAAGALAAPETLPEHPARAVLLTDSPIAVPGRPLRVGVLIKTLPGWHVYWRNPGEAGVGTRVRWSLPPGWQAGPTRWPLPVRLVEPGDVTVFAYEEGVLLTRELTVPPDARPGTRVPLAASVDWLACKSACVPGKAELDGQVVLGGERPTAGSALFDAWRDRLPTAAPAAIARPDEDGDLVVRVPLEDPGAIPDVFPDPGGPGAELAILGGEVAERELVVYLGARGLALPPTAAPGAEGPALVLVHYGPGGAVRGRRVPLVAAP